MFRTLTPFALVAVVGGLVTAGVFLHVMESRAVGSSSILGREERTESVGKLAIGPKWEIEAPYADSVVRVRVAAAAEGATTAGVGTLVAIEGAGYDTLGVLTCAHLFPTGAGRGAQAEVCFPGGSEPCRDCVTGQLLAIDREVDLAFIAVSTALPDPFQPVKLAYFSEDGPAHPYHFRHITVDSACSHVEANRSKVWAQRGDSGSPVIQGGRIVGVVRARRREHYPEAVLVDAPTVVDFLTSLRAAHVSPESGATMSR